MTEWIVRVVESAGHLGIGALSSGNVGPHGADKGHAEG